MEDDEPGTKAKSCRRVRPAGGRALPRAFFSDPLRIHATCEDYRAGRTHDLANDEADRDGRQEDRLPASRLWGARRHSANETGGPLETWQNGRRDVRGAPIDSGHFLPEENPDATAKAMIEFFT